MKYAIRCAAAVVLLAMMTGCEETGDTVLSIDGQGSIVGFAYLDRNGDGESSPGVDASYPGLRVSLTIGSRTVATAETDSLGFFRVSDLAVGTYTIDVDETSVGDTVGIVSIDSARINVIPNDSTPARITLGYSTSSAGAISTMPPGRRIVYTGVALYSWGAFGDSTLHVSDSTGAIRLAGVPAASIQAGDSIRVVATIGERDSYLALVDPTILAIRDGEPPIPIVLSTKEAADPADSAKVALVRIRSAAFLDGISLPGGDVLLTVDDESGPLEVLLDNDADINTALPIAQGAELDISGVLVPVEGTPLRWRLKPRRTADVVVSYPVISIASARTQPVGHFALVHGTVLNNLGAFSDNTIHIIDSSGAIRVTPQGAPFISAGDSVSVLGRISLRDGQPVLTDGVVSVIDRRAVPEPVEVSPAVAATADDGQLDAALVRVDSITVRSVTNVSGSYRMVVGGSADSVEVFLDRSAFGGVTPPSVGAILDVTGVLVPVNGGGRWLIRPRNSTDIDSR